MGNDTGGAGSGCKGPKLSSTNANSVAGEAGRSRVWEMRS